LVDPCWRHCRALQAPRLDAWACHDRPDLGERRGDLLLWLSREDREGVRRRGRVVPLIGERVDQLVAEAALRLQVTDAAFVPEAREFGRFRDRLAHPAKPVDEPQLVRAYRRILGRHHQVTVATGGAAGLALIEKSPDFDAIVCDLTMPDVDGVRIYRSLDRVAPHLKDRIIFSSGGGPQVSTRVLRPAVQASQMRLP